MKRAAFLFFASVFGTTVGAFLRMQGHDTAGLIVLSLSGIALISVFLLLIACVIRGNQNA